MNQTKGIVSVLETWDIDKGSAIGIERLASLETVAIGGLVVGTWMTLIFIPVGFVWLVEEGSVIEE